MNEESKTLSVALRLRRVTYEDAYVAVPVTDAIFRQKADGSMGIDFEALVAAAVRIGEDPRADWRVEGRETEAHPMQGPKPDDRESLDGVSLDPT
jgi:hypothetical protein